MPTAIGDRAGQDTLLERLDDSVALLVLTQVHYKSGRIHDMAALTRRAHEVGALVLWDLSHSAGALDVDPERLRRRLRHPAAVTSTSTAVPARRPLCSSPSVI